MSALPDTRSIGQVLYETLNPWAWRLASDSDRDIYERAAELLMKRGFDAGVEHQKKAAPPLKAREYRAQLMSERAAWAKKKKTAREALEELVSIVEGLLEEGALRDWAGVDSFTLQPARAALAALGDE